MHFYCPHTSVVQKFCGPISLNASASLVTACCRNSANPITTTCQINSAAPIVTGCRRNSAAPFVTTCHRHSAAPLVITCRTNSAAPIGTTYHRNCHCMPQKFYSRFFNCVPQKFCSPLKYLNWRNLKSPETMVCCRNSEALTERSNIAAWVNISIVYILLIQTIAKIISEKNFLHVPHSFTVLYCFAY